MSTPGGSESDPWLVRGGKPANKIRVPKAVKTDKATNDKKGKNKEKNTSTTIDPYGSILKSDKSSNRQRSSSPNPKRSKGGGKSSHPSLSPLRKASIASIASPKSSSDGYKGGNDAGNTSRSESSPPIEKQKEDLSTMFADLTAKMSHLIGGGSRSSRSSISSNPKTSTTSQKKKKKEVAPSRPAPTDKKGGKGGTPWRIR